MRYERDPLSARYDEATGRLIGRAIATPGTWVYVAVPRPRGQLPGIPAARDRGGLTEWERAYIRSLYHVLNSGGEPGRRNEAWSVQRQWGPDTPRGRLLGVRASRPATARRAMARKPKADQWRYNPELRSGAADSGQQRV